MLTILLIVLLVLALSGGGWAYWGNGPAYLGPGALGLVVIIIIILVAFGGWPGWRY